MAGSERADLSASTTQLHEGAAINKSLSSLGNVINALTEGGKDTHVPYRSSKLTRLLEESLGGNTVTVMLAAVSDDPKNVRETLSTLKYAARAKKITNKKSKNEAKEDKAKIRELTDEIARLHEQLLNGGGGGGGSGPAATAADEEKLGELRAQLERAHSDAGLANANAHSVAARNQDLAVELDAARQHNSELEALLKHTQTDQQALQNAHRAAEQDVQRLKQQINHERLNFQDESLRMTSAVEELAAGRRQIEMLQRTAADARQEASTALAKQRDAEDKCRRLEEAQRKLELSIGLPEGSGAEGLGSSLLEAERRASSELLEATTRDKQAQAELQAKNVAAFERLIASKEEQLQSLNERLQVYRDAADKREEHVAELVEQLQNRKANVEALSDSRAALVGDLTAAQEEAATRAQEASEAKRRWQELEKVATASQRELDKMRKKLMVKEVHVAQLSKDNRKQAEQMKLLQEHLDTPEALLREMLRMTEMELKLKTQLAVEKEAKMQKQVSELEAELHRFGVRTSLDPKLVKRMSFASFFSNIGGEPAASTRAGPSYSDEDEYEEEYGQLEDLAVIEPRGTGRKPERRGLLGRATPQPSFSRATERRQSFARAAPTGAERRQSFARQLLPEPLADPASSAAENVANAAADVADAAGRAVGGLLGAAGSTVGSLFGGLANFVGKEAEEAPAPPERRPKPRAKRASSTGRPRSGERSGEREGDHERGERRGEHRASSAPRGQRRERGRRDRDRPPEHERSRPVAYDEDDAYSTDRSTPNNSAPPSAERGAPQHSSGYAPPLPAPPHPVQLPDDDDDDEYDDGRRGGGRHGEGSRRGERSEGKRPIVSAPLGSPRYSDRSHSSAASTPQVTPRSPREAWGAPSSSAPQSHKRTPSTAGSMPTAKRPPRAHKPSPKSSPLTSPTTRPQPRERREAPARRPRHGQGSPNDRHDVRQVAPPLPPGVKPARRVASWGNAGTVSVYPESSSKVAPRGSSSLKKERKHGGLSPTGERPHGSRLGMPAQRAVSFALVR